MDFVDQAQVYTAVQMAGAAAALLFILLAIGVVAIHVKAKKSRPVLERIEPKLTADTADYDYDRRRGRGSTEAPGYLESHARRERPRRRYSFSNAVFSFVIGVSVGAGSFALAARYDEGVIGGDMEPGGRAVPARAVTIKDVGRLNAGSSGGERMVAERLASYVEKTIKKLPQVIDAITTMVFVESESRSVTGNFQVSRVLSDSDITKVGQFIKTKAEETMCQLPKTDDVRYLNDNGISFIFNYVDITGRPIVKFTLRQGLCSQELSSSN